MMIDLPALSIVKEVVVWLWPLWVKFGTAAAGRVVEAFGEEIGDKVAEVIEEARSLDPEQTERIDRQPGQEKAAIGELTERVVEKEPESARVISQQTWGALSKMLDDDNLFSMAEVEQIVSYLGYPITNWGGLPRHQLKARLLAEVRADGRLDELLAEMTSINPTLSRKP
jgi:hypothetical protein